MVIFIDLDSSLRSEIEDDTYLITTEYGFSRIVLSNNVRNILLFLIGINRKDQYLNN